MKMNMKKQHQSTQLTDKFPPHVVSRGCTYIPNCLIYCRRSLELNDPEFAVLAFLYSAKFNTKDPYYSVAKIALHLNKKPGSIRDNLRSLERKGFIERELRNGFSSIYKISPSWEKIRSHACISPIGKSRGGYQKSDTSPYRNSSTKEEDPKKRHLNKKTESIGQILLRRPP